MKKVDWDSIGVVVFLLITFICKLFSCVLHGVYAFQDGRRGLSTFKNMPFLPREGRFLRARRAYTRTQNITRWFLVGYILDCRRWYLRVVRVVGLVGCKDFSSSCWLVSDKGVVCEVTPFGLLMIGDGPLNILRTYRGISVITPLSIRRGAGGEALCGCKVLWNRLTWCLCGPLCVLFICVLCEKKNIFETRRGVLSLTECTEFTERYNTRSQATWRWSVS